jgi:hypothetical protein
MKSSAFRDIRRCISEERILQTLNLYIFRIDEVKTRGYLHILLAVVVRRTGNRFHLTLKHTRVNTLMFSHAAEM